MRIRRGSRKVKVWATNARDARSIAVEAYRDHCVNSVHREGHYSYVVYMTKKRG